MQPQDGNYESVYKAVHWTVDEFCFNEEDLSIYADFEEGGTFDLFQEPTIGWITPDSEKLGYRAQKLTFKYVDNRVNLIACSGINPMSLTALKTAVAVTKLLSNSMTRNIEFPNAQPLSPSDWDFPVVGGWINVEKVKEWDVDGIKNEINPSDPTTNFAIGRLYDGQELNVSGKIIHEGDIIVIRRSHTNPTFAKVLAVGKRGINVAVKTDDQGKTLAHKSVPIDSILCHWGSINTSENHKHRKRKF